MQGKQLTVGGHSSQNKIGGLNCFISIRGSNLGDAAYPLPNDIAYGPGDNNIIVLVTVESKVLLHP
jgi:hypothetical protein